MYLVLNIIDFRMNIGTIVFFKNIIFVYAL